VTHYGHEFDAGASHVTKGSHKGEKVIHIKKDGNGFAYIYQCCWQHQTNCYGTRIGGYSEALDKWCGTQIPRA